MLSITIIIVIITTIISISAFYNERVMNDLIFYPPAVKNQNQWYRFFSCGLIHGDWPHLIFNMIALYSFGSFVEQAFDTTFAGPGRALYAIMYVSALLTSLLPTYNRYKDSYSYRSLGASGAVSAVIFSGLLLLPAMEVGFIFFPIGIPGFLFGPLYLLVTAYMDKRGDTNINHSAHLWGSLYGLAFTLAAGYATNYDVIGNFVDQIRMYFNR